MSKRHAFFSRWSVISLPIASTLVLLAAVHTASAQMISGTLAVKKVVVNQVGPSATIPSTFNITTHCSQNAAYPGSNTPVAVPPGQTVVQSTTMPPGIICSVTEVVPPPISGLADCKGRNAVWTASYSPPVTIASGQTSTLTVTNTLACAAPTGGSLTVFKEVVNTLGVPNPANFAVSVSCTGMPVVPLQIAPNQSIPISNNIPGGTVCTVTETLPPPVSGVKACPSGTASWVANIPGPQTIQVAQGTAMIVRNTLTCDKPQTAKCPNPTQNSIGCRITVTIKRTKGAPIYSVLVSPGATVTTPNVAPSTGASCVIGSNVMINQTTCWFNYNTNPTTVTLTATSSTGTLPSSFNWSGACSGSNAVCVLPATLTQQLVTANF